MEGIGKPIQILKKDKAQLTEEMLQSLDMNLLKVFAEISESEIRV